MPMISGSDKSKLKTEERNQRGERLYQYDEMERSVQALKDVFRERKVGEVLKETNQGMKKMWNGNKREAC